MNKKGKALDKWRWIVYHVIGFIPKGNPPYGSKPAVVTLQIKRSIDVAKITFLAVGEKI